jgi:hypothetical protein
MNVIFFDPTFVSDKNLAKLGTVLKISDVYCLMPMIKDDYKIYRTFRSKVKVWRKTGETLDSATRRAVYALSNMVSSSRIVDGIFLGKEVFNRYENSKYDAFVENIELDDPNILILRPDEYLSDERCDTVFFDYFFNILRKYDSNNQYRERIARRVLSPFLSLRDNSICELAQTIKKSDVGKSTKFNAQLILFLLESFNCTTSQELRSLLLLTPAESKRLEVIEIIENERRWEEEMARFYADREEARAEAEAERQDYRSEMEDIINNGGDWILDR